MTQLLARSTQRGQSLLEACVVIGVFGTLLLGILQSVLFYQAKTVVDYAALQAARSGATNFAEMGSMRVGLARGLMPLYTFQAGPVGAAKGYAKAYLAARNPLTSEITIISPTRAAFDDHQQAEFDGVKAIPNDSLMFRSSAPGASGLSVQDANILKIRVVYGYKMVVPVIDKIVLGVFRAAHYSGMSAKEILMLESGELPIVAQAVVRMQTPFRDRDLLAATGGSGGGGAGGDDGGPKPPGAICTE